MVESVISENKLKLPSCGLPRIYRKYAPDKSRKIHLPESLALNPGTLSNFHKEFLACISNQFTGLHFAINKFIPSTGVKLKNKLRIGTTEVNDELITKYMTTRQTRFGKHDMLIEAMTNFKTPWPLISISQIFDDFWYMSIAYSLQEKKLKSDVEVEYYGRIATLALKYTSYWPSSPVATCSISYLRSITQKLALGTQLTLCSSSMRSQPNQQLSDVTYYARYRGPTYIACLDFCKTTGYHFSYFRNINEYLACAINITGSIDDYTQLRSTIGIKTKIPEYGLIVRGNLANDGAICGIVKKQFIKDFPIKIIISGSYNLFAGDYSFGIGFSA
uniref:Uncharacterized protein n=2 Tax=Onchocerca TaxID=6281 RepID=A0A8R1XN89_ONCVO